MIASLIRLLADDPAPVTAEPRTAIIDIGSNSVRLVVYQGHPRLPATIFNEKVMAGLGRGLAESGKIDDDALALAHTALRRFAAVVREMDAKPITVATAAVRDAANGEVLLSAARALGLDPIILSGDAEAKAAGDGVLSGIPNADGIVGDLGGGSLELVCIKKGKAGDRVSFPIGVLRIAGIAGKGGKSIERQVAKLIKDAGWEGKGASLPFYLVGGSWRALARLDMHLAGYPLPIIHQYRMSADTVDTLRRATTQIDKQALRAVQGLSSARAATLADAAALLSTVLRALGSTGTVVSAYGLREGLLYDRLDGDTRRLDPLIVGARAEGKLLGRFAEHGDLLADWIGALFKDEPKGCARIRHAACLLADVGWHANPEFRAERGMEVALHGNWVAIEAPERAMLAQTLFTSLGGGMAIPEPLGRIATASSLERARDWGLAIRFGQRFSAGLAGPLTRSRLELDGSSITLSLAEKDRGLYGETVEKRHFALAASMKRKARLEDIKQ